jgi:hypothetical protein
LDLILKALLGSSALLDLGLLAIKLGLHQGQFGRHDLDLALLRRNRLCVGVIA